MADDAFEGLREALEEARDWSQGKIGLETVKLTPLPGARIKAIRKTVSKSRRAFEAEFGIPASTLENWETERRAPDPAARLLLRILEADPEAVRRAAQAYPEHR